MLSPKTAFRTVRIAFLLLACFIGPDKVYAQDEIPITKDQTATLFPIDVEEKVESNYGVIIRTYALKPDEKPGDIPINSFDKYGVRYELSEIIKKENRSEDKLTHTETITINTPGNDMNEILNQLSQEIPYEKDGYAGKLSLDISTITCEAAGYKMNSYTLTVTREYPHLSSNDTSLIPKTVTDRGVTYSLADVSFNAQGTNSIDYESIPTSYTAVAKYTTKGSSQKVTGYVTTAEYHGEIIKTLTNETIFKAYFISKSPVVEPESTPEPTPEPDPIESEKPMQSINARWLLPVIMSILSILLSAGAVILLFLKFSHNTIVYSKQGVEYKKIGQLKVDYKVDNPTVNLTKLASKTASLEFVIELSKDAMKKIFDRGKEINDIQVIYKDKSITHTIAPYATADKYQFEISFAEDKGDDFYEEE